MSDKPILFSAPMVRALLAGRKTQTRRLHKVVPGLEHLAGSVAPRIAVGDRLYVREHWRTDTAYNNTAPRELSDRVALWYEADGATIGDGVKGRFRQGMHMPRWASRITLTVTDVRVQRLQEISEKDAIAEGIRFVTDIPGIRFGIDLDGGLIAGGSTAVDAYRVLWATVNGEADLLLGHGSWYRNPWVAAYTFTVEQRNIDSARAT